MAQRLHDKMDVAEKTTETSIVKFEGAVDQVLDTVKQIDDAANQMTNGGPPLGDGSAQ
jgi:hypothetical protein